MTDFILDVSRSSATFGQSISVELSEMEPQALLIPPCFAHGFLAGDKGAQVLYAVTQERSVDHEISINYESTSIGRELAGVKPIRSEKDKLAMSIDDFVAMYPNHKGHP